jgi:hypothetical protein
LDVARAARPLAQVGTWADWAAEPDLTLDKAEQGILGNNLARNLDCRCRHGADKADDAEELHFELVNERVLQRQETK